jgi:hypothetical protein
LNFSAIGLYSLILDQPDGGYNGCSKIPYIHDLACDRRQPSP